MLRETEDTGTAQDLSRRTPMPLDKHRNCTTNMCTCANGTAATGIDCEVHGDPVCVSCDAETKWLQVPPEARRKLERGVSIEFS